MNFFNYFTSNYNASAGIDVNKLPYELNRVDYLNDYNLMLSLFLSRFKWDIPLLDEQAFTKQYLERCLFYYGNAAFLDTETYGIRILPCQPVSYNPFGEPFGFKLYPYRPDGAYTNIDSQEENIFPSLDLSRIYTVEEIAVISENPSLYGPVSSVRRYCGKTADLQRTEEVYAISCKRPTIMFVDASNKMSAKIVKQQLDSNADNIVLYNNKKGLENISPTSINTGATPTELLQLMKARALKLNEALARIGIVGDTVVKSAQLTEDEVKSNNTLAETVLQDALMMRTQGVENVKRMFPELEISFKLNERYKTKEEEKEDVI